MTKVTYQIEPLTCPSCVLKIEGTLEKTSGVETAKVLFNSSKVKAEIDETKVKPEEVKRIIEKLGYDVISFK